MPVSARARGIESRRRSATTIQTAGTFVHDTFTGTTGTALSSHVGETGATWTAAFGTMVLDGSNMVYSTTSGAALFLASGVPPAADYSVDVALQALSAIGELWVAARWTTGGPDGYIAMFSGAASTVEIQKVLAGGSRVTLASAAWTPTGGTYTFSVAGSSSTVLTIKSGTTVLVTATDTSSPITPAGSVGIGGDLAGTATTGLHADTLTASYSYMAFPTIPAGSVVTHQLDWEDGQVKNTSTWPGGTFFSSNASTDGVTNARMQVVTSTGPTVTGITTPTAPATIPQGTKCLYCEVRSGDALIAGGPRSQISGGYLTNAHEYIWMFRLDRAVLRRGVADDGERNDRTERRVAPLD
jgi:hypothetical protein